MGIFLSPFLKKISKDYIGHWCPGCCLIHLVRVHSDQGDPVWAFDNTNGLPSFTPSVMIHTNQPRTILELTQPVPHVQCHYSLREGIIQYFEDSLHQYAGRAIPLPPLPTYLKGAS